MQIATVIHLPDEDKTVFVLLRTIMTDKEKAYEARTKRWIWISFGAMVAFFVMGALCFPDNLKGASWGTVVRNIVSLILVAFVLTKLRKKKDPM